MRILNTHEVELVSGGSFGPANDGDSVGWNRLNNIVLSYGAGTAAGGTLGMVIEATSGTPSIARWATRGGPLGTWGYLWFLGATAAGADKVGGWIGQELYESQVQRGYAKPLPSY
jgi:hypothetical protein